MMLKDVSAFLDRGQRRTHSVTVACTGAGVIVIVGVMVCFLNAYSGIVRTLETVGVEDVELDPSLV
jgi:predicted NAD/FAD-binding protein